MMKLYLYETCPFCVRVRMMLGLKRIACELVYLCASDTETPMRLVSARQVPILQSDDGTTFADSFRIIQYLDRLDERPILEHAVVSHDLEHWYTTMRNDIDQLCYPRYAVLKPPELENPAAMAWFQTSRKSKMGISLEEAMSRTTELCSRLQGSFAALDRHVDEYLNRGRAVTADDFFLFPFLRNLTLVRALVMPAKLNRYVHDLSHRSRVPVYSERAV